MVGKMMYPQRKWNWDRYCWQVLGPFSLYDCRFQRSSYQTPWGLQYQGKRVRRVFVKHVLKRRGKKGFVQACNAYFPIHTSTAERPFPPQQIHNFPLRGRGTMPCAPLGRTGLLAALEDLTVTFSFPNARQIHFLSVGQSKHGWPATVTTIKPLCSKSSGSLFSN